MNMYEMSYSMFLILTTTVSRKCLGENPPANVPNSCFLFGVSHWQMLHVGNTYIYPRFMASHVGQYSIHGAYYRNKPLVFLDLFNLLTHLLFIIQLTKLSTWGHNFAGTNAAGDVSSDASASLKAFLRHPCSVLPEGEQWRLMN